MGLTPEQIQILLSKPVDGIKMCRRCFLDGYGKVSEDQESLDEATGGETSE
jgi:hypothetical protein